MRKPENLWRRTKMAEAIPITKPAEPRQIIADKKRKNAADKSRA